MKKSLLMCILSLFVSGFIFTGCKQDKAAAIVNGIAVPMSEYNKVFNQTVNTLKIKNPNILQQQNAEKNISKLVLENLITRELFLQQAQKSNATASQEEINTVINNAKARFAKDENGNELTQEQQDKAFEEALKKQGFSLETYTRQITNDIIIAKYREAVVAKNLNKVTDEETKRFFDNISAIYENDTKKIEELKKVPGLFEEANVVAEQLKVSLAAKARIEIILVFADKSMSKEEFAQRHNLAKNIRDEILKTNFADTAAKYSSDTQNRVYSSKMNIFEGMEPTEISSKAFDMNIGKTSDIIEVFRENAPANIAQGFFIINVIEKTAKKDFAYSEFKEQLENYINSKRAENVLLQVTKELRDKGEIKILINNSDTASVSTGSATK